MKRPIFKTATGVVYPLQGDIVTKDSGSPSNRRMHAVRLDAQANRQMMMMMIMRMT